MDHALNATPGRPASDTPPGRDTRAVLPPLWLLVLWCALVLSLWPAARRELSDYNAVPPDDLESAVVLYQSHRYAEAVEMTQRYLRRQPGSAEALLNLGLSYAGMEKWDDAISAMQRSLLIRPDFKPAWHNLQWLLAARLAAKPTAESYKAEAITSYLEGNYRECVDLSRRALALYPEYTRALVMQSICYRQLGMTTEAIASAREALRIEPDSSAAEDSLRRALEQNLRQYAPVKPGENR